MSDRIKTTMTEAKDVNIGDVVGFEGSREVWTVMSKRRIPRKTIADKYVFKLQFIQPGVIGEGMTRPLPADYRVMVYTREESK